MARHLITTNEGIVQLLMDFKCFLIQYNEVKKKHGYPQYVEVLLEECKYFLCEKMALEFI